MGNMITYVVGDLSNGGFAEYETEAEAMLALEEAIDDGTVENIKAIGEYGCSWKTASGAREAAEEFFYVIKRIEEIDEYDYVTWVGDEIIAGNIQ